MASTTKFNRAASPRTLLTFTDSEALNFPNGDWTVSALVAFNGSDLTNVQYLMRTGEFQVVGGLIIYLSSDGAGKMIAGAYVNGNGAGTPLSLPMDPATPHILAITRLGSGVTMRVCPVLSSAPVDGSAVVKRPPSGDGLTSHPLEVGMNGLDLLIGGRNTTDRQFDQSLGRLIRVDRALTDLEVAQLAFGMEVKDLPTPTTPVWNFRLTGPSDLDDSGPLDLQPTVSGTFVAGAEVPFGYVPTASAPTITGTPAINGTPGVGIAVSYTPAAVGGSPNPTTTQQWTLDGVDIAGATGASYTPTAPDAGKTLRVRQIATNTEGSANATSAGVAVANSAPDVGVAELVAERIYQRVSGTAAVALSGTFAGPTLPTKIEYQLYALDGVTVRQVWTDALATIVAGTWTAAPLVPAAATKYRIAVRSKDSGGAVLATGAVKTNPFGVGDIIVAVGSSSAWSWFNEQQGFTELQPVQDSVSVYSTAGGWTKTPVASPAVGMANHFVQQLGVCVAVVNCGYSGSTVGEWLNKNSDRWALLANAMPGLGGKLGGAFLSVGSNEASNDYMVESRASHLTNMRALVTNIRDLTEQPALPILWSGMNRRTEAVTDIRPDYVRMAECDIGNDANVYHVQTLDFELGSDGVHLTAAGFRASCVRNRLVWAQARLGTYRRGPKITAMDYSGSSVVVTLAHRGGTDISPAANITGFTVSDASGVPAITSVVRTNATHITLTCDRPLVAPVVTKYLSGKAPVVGTPVFDNGAIALPMTVETDMAVVEGAGAALATTVSFSVVDDAGNPVTGLSGLDYAFYDAPRISAGVAPVKSGTDLAISGGSVTISIAGVTALSPGGIGRIEWGDAAGTKRGGGQVTVS